MLWNLYIYGAFGNDGAVWLLAREHMFYFCFYVFMNGWFRSIGKQGNWVSGSLTYMSWLKGMAFRIYRSQLVWDIVWFLMGHGMMGWDASGMVYIGIYFVAFELCPCEFRF